jgi:Ca2+-dependent lipid-binding protein
MVHLLIILTGTRVSRSCLFVLTVWYMYVCHVLVCNSPAELLKKDATFSIKIVSAKGLPAAYANDPYVTFTFWDQHFETEAIDGKTVVPIWECEKRYRSSLTSDMNLWLINARCGVVV